MKKFLRRCTAALLAAGTIWVVAATAESSSAAAAVSAMRDSFHLQRLLVQLELGGAARKKGMNLSTLLCLGQSPLLWAAYGALPEEEPEPVPKPVEPAPAPQPTGPVEGDAAAGLTFADNGAPSQTVIPSSGKSYTVAGNVYIKNSSDYTLDPAALDGTFPAKLGSADALNAKFDLMAEKCSVNYSCYFGATNNNYPLLEQLDKHRVCGVKLFMGSSTGNMLVDKMTSLLNIFNSTDLLIATHCEDQGIIKENTEKYLSQYGISVLHDRQIHDTDYNSAYDKSYSSAAAYLEQYPSISFVLDVHRDAISDAEGRQYKVVSQEDPRAAQVSIVMGSSYDSWMDNLRLAAAVQGHLLEQHPTLMRPIILRYYGYNQSLSTGSMLVEIGAAGNSLDEAVYAARLFAAGFAETVGAASTT